MDKFDPAVAHAAAQQLRQQTSWRPVHVHTCPDGHQWTCPSPYCEDVNVRLTFCPGHHPDGAYPKGTSAEDFINA